MNKPERIFVLLEDVAGTMSSMPEPFGVAVTSEAEAKEWVSRAKHGYSRRYAELKIYPGWREALFAKSPNFYYKRPELLK
jgi:hypothetical protein